MGHSPRDRHTPASYVIANLRRNPAGWMVSTLEPQDSTVHSWILFPSDLGGRRTHQSKARPWGAAAAVNRSHAVRDLDWDAEMRNRRGLVSMWVCSQRREAARTVRRPRMHVPCWEGGRQVVANGSPKGRSRIRRADLPASSCKTPKSA